MAAVTIPAAVTTHAIAGRFRVRIPERKRDEPYFARVAEELKSIEGVLDVTTNPWTGSVLVLHRLSHDMLSAEAAARGLFRVEEQKSALSTAGDYVEHALATEEVAEDLLRADPRFRNVTLGLLVAAGLYQGLKGKFLPPGLTLLTYALGVLNRSRTGPA